MPWMSVRTAWRSVAHDQAHGNAGHRSLDGHAGVHQRQGAAADAGHDGEPLDESTSLTTRMV